jgi:hypothetical protein
MVAKAVKECCTVHEVDGAREMPCSSHWGGTVCNAGTVSVQLTATRGQDCLLPCSNRQAEQQAARDPTDLVSRHHNVRCCKFNSYQQIKCKLECFVYQDVLAQTVRHAEVRCQVLQRPTACKILLVAILGT